MGEGFLQTVRQVGIFMICAQMIMHFKPAESYGKYIRLLTGMMVLVQLIVPVLEIFGGGETEFRDKVSYYDEIIGGNMEEISITGAASEKILESMTMEEVQARLEEQSLLSEQSLSETQEPLEGTDLPKAQEPLEGTDLPKAQEPLEGTDLPKAQEPSQGTASPAAGTGNISVDRIEVADSD